jgi:hypothetical protein
MEFDSGLCGTRYLKCRDLFFVFYGAVVYLITHNTHKRQISITLAGFELTGSTGKWPQTYALDRVAVGTGRGVISYW